MLNKDSMANTFLVSLVLCVVCSLVVSGAAVSLKSIQEKNKKIDRYRNIIAAASISEKPAAELTSDEVEKLYQERVFPELLDLSTGEYVEDPDPDYLPKEAAKDPEQNADIEGYDIGVSKREQKTWVYLIKDSSGKTESVVLPIYGMGLWSTLYGYIAVDNDFRTIKGLTYYEHAETPGLGGEVDNPLWKQKWVGKQIWATGEPREDDNLKVGVAKGGPPAGMEDYMVDGLSGATITSRGVDSMLKYWFSDNAFGPFVRKLAADTDSAAASGDGEAPTETNEETDTETKADEGNSDADNSDTEKEGASDGGTNG
ncbi:MAG: Na(+)-translocating NADH-quinone reductase subunit C [Aureliella sp.]